MRYLSRDHQKNLNPPYQKSRPVRLHIKQAACAYWSVRGLPPLTKEAYEAGLYWKGLLDGNNF